MLLHRQHEVIYTPWEKNGALRLLDRDPIHCS